MTSSWNPRKPDVERFTQGDCHYLARAIHKLTGWPMMAFEDPWDPDGNYHAFIQTPDGKIIDIEGIHDVAEFCKRWRLCMNVSRKLKPTTVTWDNLKHWGSPDFGDWTYTRSRTMARRLLEHFYPEVLHGI